MLRMWSVFALCLLVAACSQQRTLDNGLPSYRGAMPANFSGSWERDYSRGDDVNGVLSGIFYQLNRRAEQRRAPRRSIGAGWPHTRAPPGFRPCPRYEAGGSPALSREEGVQKTFQ